MIAFKLGMDVTLVEAMSHRQIVRWVEFFSEDEEQPMPPGSEGAISYSSLSKADLKAAFR